MLSPVWPFLQGNSFRKITDRCRDQLVTDPRSASDKSPVIAPHGTIVFNFKARGAFVLHQHFLPKVDAVHEVTNFTRKLATFIASEMFASEMFPPRRRYITRCRR